MFKILTLICLGGDPSTCTAANAVDVVEGPLVGLQQCMFGAQSQIARTALAPGPGQTMKVICRPARTAER